MAKYRLSFSQISSGIIVPAAIVAIGVVGYFVLLPKYRDIKTTRFTLDSKRAEAAVRSAKFSGIESLVQELKKKRSDLLVIDEALPPAPRIPELLANFDSLAQQSGMFLADLQVTPAPTLGTLSGGQSVSQAKRLEALLTATKSLGVMQAKLTLRGSYNNFKTFLLNTEQNLRLLDAQGFLVSAANDKSDLKDFSLLIYTYYQKE